MAECAPASDRRAELRRVYAEIMAAVDVRQLLRRAARRDGSVLVAGPATVDLAACRRVVVVAFGKAALPMAHGALELLAGHGDATGLVVVPPGASGAPMPASVRVVHGGHPRPDAGSLAAARAAERAVAGLGPDDLVLWLVSGGGSALLERPIADAFPLADCAALHDALVASGGDIVALNVVRKHLSAVKGGRLAAAAAPARQLTLVLSDVPAGHLDAVASGPTLPDRSTVADCRRVLRELALAPRLPPAVQRVIADPRLPETPKPGDPAFARVAWHGIGSSDDALAALVAAAERRGFVVRTVAIDGAGIGDAVTAMLAALDALRQQVPDRTVAVAAAGELALPLPPASARGSGGRAQHFALHCARRIAGQSVAVLAAGTDGIDGSSPAAGAVADGSTLARAVAMGIDPARHERDCDSHGLFARLGDAIVTGPSGNNLRDVMLLVGGAPAA